MKLAIAVVYIVHESHGGLLDLHLSRIARHTSSVPYAIYGSVTRLLPRYRLALQRHGVRTFDLPESPHRGSLEHRDYLEPLIAAAIDDGATHVLTLHVDSFPVADGWVERLAQELSAGNAFATLERLNTACFLFPREFYLEHRPPLLADAATQESPEWSRFLRETGVLTHCGSGYAFAAWRAGLTWHSMRASGTRPGWSGSVLYDGTLFHLQGALRLAPSVDGSAAAAPAASRRVSSSARMVRRALDRARRFAPAPLRRLVRGVSPALSPLTLSTAEKRWEAAGMSSDLDALVADPDAFLASLR